MGYYKGLKRLYRKNKSVHKEKVKQKKPIPVYCTSQSITLAVVLATDLTFMYVETHFGMEETLSNLSWCVILFGLSIVMIELWENRVLYLCKNNTNVVEYNTNIKDLERVAGILSYLSWGHLVNEKCECVKLDNGIEFWQCYSWRKSNRYYNNHIFAIIQYESENNMNLLLTNSLEGYLNAENIYISRYSNLPPFVISNENEENICQDIEKLCSDFLARTRSTYALIIKDGQICLGLDYARFGKFNRIINKKRTKKLTEEAMQEISEFLLQIKSVIEKY